MNITHLWRNMSTKNLARTAIEGGRIGIYKSVRDDTNRRWRHKASQYLKDVARDPELYDDEGINLCDEEPLNDWEWDDKFDDKLSPVKRWVEKQIGRHIDDVYADIREKFDVRTTPGRHIVEGHLNSYLKYDWGYRYGRTSGGVASYGEDGILYESDYWWRRNRHRSEYSAIERDVSRYNRWKGNHNLHVGKVGNKYFWFVRARSKKWHWTFDIKTKAYYFARGWGGFRQDIQLHKNDVAFIESLHPKAQTKILFNPRKRNE